MPLDHKAKISIANLEEAVEILEDSKIFVVAMYPTMVWNLIFIYNALFKIIPVGNLRSMGHLAPPLVSRILFRFLIFNCYNISICKKEELKDETSKKIRETNGSQ
jgi:hypothetical protein